MTAHTAIETARLVRTGEAKAEEIVALALGRIDDRNARLNAFLQVFHERALEQARAVDTRVASGDADVLPLAGVPIALKDNICLSWGRTTCASKMLENYESPYTATAARRLTAAGAIVVGKTNLDEFAMGSSNEHSAFGPVRNPWDESRVPGGSSGGSAAAVAAGLVPIALGSDTGGSIRQPASHCGVVGLKPTYGRVSRYGLVAYASSLDQIGPMTTSVADAALALDIIAGEDPNDATSARGQALTDPTLTNPSGSLGAGLEDMPPHLTVGIPSLVREADLDPRVRRVFDDAVQVLRDAGARIVDVPLPHAHHGIAAYYIVAPAEASSNLARYDGIRYGTRPESLTALGANATLDDLYLRSRTEGLGEEVRRRIMLGTHVLSSGYHDAYYTNACRVRRLIKRDYDDAFTGASTEHPVDAVLMPAAPGPAFPIGEKYGDPLAEYLEDAFTVGVNLAGLPGITVPGGWVDEGGRELPVGVQFIGPAWKENHLLRTARLFERESGMTWRLPA